LSGRRRGDVEEGVLKKYHPPVIILNTTLIGHVIVFHIPSPVLGLARLRLCDPDKRLDPGGALILDNESSTSNCSIDAREDDVGGGRVVGGAGPESVAKSVSTARCNEYKLVA
jgi:hypothetical protein